MDATSSEQPSPPLLRPQPRRPFTLLPSTSSTTLNTDTPSQPCTPLPVEENNEPNDSQANFSRSRSIVNLTSSTLSGIYSPSSFTDASVPPTPWDTGARTPLRNESIEAISSYSRGPRGSEIEARLLEKSSGRTSSQAHHAPQSQVVSLLRTILRVVLLFGFGLAYGGLIAHLHDNRNVAPVRVEGLDRASWRYFLFWGMSGVGMGSLLPWIDGEERQPSTGISSGQWNEVVRSVGAFVGVAFAIRKLPWSSPLQLTLTLALVNPFLWYLIDRTLAGFTLSSLFGILGTATLLMFNPALVPSASNRGPATTSTTTNYTGPAQTAAGETLVGGLFSYEIVGVATWIASVMFCSCVCFGSIGRLLVPSAPVPLANSIGKRRAGT
ncbi:putative 26S protease subunit [Venturia nashicola]|uniref:Putative 26S protease subunit n=1 Tax=Venturia nashicola TaxID=86259 RepID=A0A4Z1PGQ8_9PEZI|nr:putative 26S protease subunit [Venturia nashicola]TLD39551.1 putative 26S protease subunit [Venturia nashicola]